MSILLPNVRTRIRVKLKEADARKPIGIIRLDQEIRDTYLVLQSRLPPARVQVDSAFTIAAAADTFALPTSTNTIEYAGEIRIQLVSNGAFLKKLTDDEMSFWRDRQPSSHQAKPEYYSLWEEDDQEVQGRCYPRSKDAEACNLFRSLVAADFDLTNVSATQIKFSRHGIEALINKVAASLLESMTEEDLGVRRINPQVAERWELESERALYQEAVRRGRIGRVGRIQRRVS